VRPSLGGLGTLAGRFTLFPEGNRRAIPQVFYALAMADRLSSHQRRLVRQLDEIAQLARVDFYRIAEYEPESRTVRLHLMRDQLVRSVVIRNYTWIDEALGSAVCQYFFGEHRRSFMQLWRTQKFRRFNHYVLETLSLLEKLRLVHAIREVPKAIRSDIEALNALRNGLAHSFFPQNLRGSRPVWKGQNIFSLHGFRKYVEDVGVVTDYLTRRFYDRRPKRPASNARLRSDAVRSMPTGEQLQS
jgi:hypothetical protein